MASGYYSHEELLEMGFASVGKNVLLSREAKIYGADKIRLGNYVRIDDFVILSGKIEIGNFIHIGASSNITGSDIGVTIKDFCGISSHVRIFALSDDYTGESMTNPWIPDHFKHIQKAPIILEKHCIIGSGSMLLPGAYLAEGVSVGAMSLMLRATKAWGIYFGIPAKRIKERNQKILQLEKEFLNSLNKVGGGDNLYSAHSPYCINSYFSNSQISFYLLNFFTPCSLVCPHIQPSFNYLASFSFSPHLINSIFTHPNISYILASLSSHQSLKPALRKHICQAS